MHTFVLDPNLRFIVKPRGAPHVPAQCPRRAAALQSSSPASFASPQALSRKPRRIGPTTRARITSSDALRGCASCSQRLRAPTCGCASLMCFGPATRAYGRPDARLDPTSRGLYLPLTLGPLATDFPRNEEPCPRA